MKKAAVLLIIAAIVAVSFTGCSLLSGLINAMVPDYSARHPEIVEPDFIDYKVYRGYYGELSDNEKTAYRCIYNNIFSYPLKIEIPQVTQAELSRVFESLKYDNPHITFLAAECSASSSAGRCYFLPRYSADAKTADSNTAEMLSLARELVLLDRGDMNEYAVQLFIHDSLCALCSYDDSSDFCNTAYGAIVEKKALCMGYSYAYKLMLDMAGIESAIVLGDAENELTGTVRHMWNAVKNHGMWYHTDTTWDDPSGQDSNSRGEVRHCYFNLSGSEISLDHHITKKPSYVVCDAVTDGYYRREGLFCNSEQNAFELINRTVIGVAVNGDIMAEFRFESADVLREVRKGLFENGGMYDILKQAAKCGAVGLDKSFIRYTVIDKLNVLIIFLQYE